MKIKNSNSQEKEELNSNTSILALEKNSIENYKLIEKNYDESNSLEKKIDNTITSTNIGTLKYVARLKEVKELYDSGILDEEEYKKLKDAVLEKYRMTL